MLLLASATSAQVDDLAGPSLLEATFLPLPVCFIENRGLYPDEAAYYVPGASRTVLFTRDGITFRPKGTDRGPEVKLAFVGANPGAAPRGEDRQPAVFSYFQGPEKEWRTGLRTFAKVVYDELWPGIDLVYRGAVNRLKYEFLVEPGADPSRIRLRYHGAVSLTVTRGGALRVETPEGSFDDAPPVAWQEIEGKRVPVATTFALGEGREFHFDVGGYDRTRALVLDPAVLVYCGYVGTSNEYASDVAVDSTGNAYVTGLSGQDVFVAKIDRSGRSLVYVAYLKGQGFDAGSAVAVDAHGAAYVAGTTGSDEKTFPVKVGPDLTFNGGYEAFVAKVNPAGTGLDYCGYVGGAGPEQGWAIAVDAMGNAYVVGETGSAPTTFPVKLGPRLVFSGMYDAFIAKVDASGTSFHYCGYIGGSGTDMGRGIAVDGSGHAYVSGWTNSNEQSFPVKIGPDLSYNGQANPYSQTDDAFVAKVNAAGTGFDYCGYIGGSLFDFSNDIAVDAQGHAYVIGTTHSTGTTQPNPFPVKVGPFLTGPGGFVTKVDPTGKSLVYSGFIPQGYGEDIAVDGQGNAYVSGNAVAGLPVKGGLGSTFGGGMADAFVARIQAGGRALDFCGYVGGAGDDRGYGVALDPLGNVYMAGLTTSTQATFPVKVGPGLTYTGGQSDPFIAQVGQTMIVGSGTPRAGSTVTLHLLASAGVGLPYQLGTSLGTGPIPIDARTLSLSPDNLLVATVFNHWPSIFSDYQGAIGANGQARAAVHIPNVPALVGVRLHSAFLTLDPVAPSGVRSISNTFSFSVAK